jgi:hypothetical protein
VNNYIQITFFDEEMTNERIQRQLAYEKSMRCYHCVKHESYRCRNEKVCPDGLHYEEYTGSTVRQCLCATVEVYQDGYIHCPIMTYIGCEKCIEDFGNGSKFHRDESQNYERIPKWKVVVME